MGPPTLISVAEARERVLAASRPLASESVPVEAALGRVLAEEVRAEQDLPPFDASAMDGFAVVAGPATELQLAGESRAGEPAGERVEPGTAARISTGAVIPAGADAVVPVERTELEDGRVRVPDTEPGANVRRAGEDVPAGQPVLAPGTELGAAEVAVLASLGLVEVRCARRPRVGVVVTGDELVPPGQPLGPGQIRDSNGIAVASLAVRAGAEVVMRETIGDDAEATREALGAALEAADLVCVSGGVSVGPHDHVREALESLGVEERFWGVRFKPGKPTWFGARGERLAFGLPGNPVSSMVCFVLFARPALRRLLGADPGATRATAVLDRPAPLGPREQAVRCRLRAAEDGWHVEPTGPQGSHRLTSMLGAGALALVPEGEGELPAGERVEIELLDH